MFKEKRFGCQAMKENGQDRIGMNGRFFEGMCMERSTEDEPMNLTRCQSCGLPQLYDALEGWKFVCG